MPVIMLAPCQAWERQAPLTKTKMQWQCADLLLLVGSLPMLCALSATRQLHPAHHREVVASCCHLQVCSSLVICLQQPHPHLLFRRAALPLVFLTLWKLMLVRQVQPCLHLPVPRQQLQSLLQLLSITPK